MLIDKHVTTISSKSEKKAFDDNELAKVIAYMSKNTQGKTFLRMCQIH